MATSTIPEVKATLKTLFETAEDLSGVQVVRYHPGMTIEREAIVIGRAFGRHDPAAIRSGRQPREEAYAVEVTASVLASGEEHEEAEARAYELIAAVEDVVAGAPRLGLSTIHWALPGEIEDRAGQTDTGAVAEVVLRIEVQARLS